MSTHGRQTAKDKALAIAQAVNWEFLEENLEDHLGHPPDGTEITFEDCLNALSEVAVARILDERPLAERALSDADAVVTVAGLPQGETYRTTGRILELLQRKGERAITLRNRSYLSPLYVAPDSEPRWKIEQYIDVIDLSVEALTPSERADVFAPFPEAVDLPTAIAIWKQAHAARGGVR